MPEKSPQSGQVHDESRVRNDDFRGDPRRVIGHPSNPTNDALKAMALVEPGGNESGGVEETGDPDITLPRGVAVAERLRAMYPGGILVPRSSGIEAGWTISTDRQQEVSKDSSGNQIYEPLSDDEVLIESPDGLFTKTVKSAFLIDRTGQNKLRKELEAGRASGLEEVAREAVAVASNLVDTASTGLPDAADLVGEVRSADPLSFITDSEQRRLADLVVSQHAKVVALPNSSYEEATSILDFIRSIETSLPEDVRATLSAIKRQQLGMK